MKQVGQVTGNKSIFLFGLSSSPEWNRSTDVLGACTRVCRGKLLTLSLLRGIWRVIIIPVGNLSLTVTLAILNIPVSQIAMLDELFLFCKFMTVDYSSCSCGIVCLVSLLFMQ